jgi:flagellar L-ring protein precursor FlgH
MYLTQPKNRVLLKSISFILLGLLASCGPKNLAIDSSAAVIPEKIYPKPVTQEGSIWPGDSTSNLFFKDTKARKVGDIVTVTISEITTSSQTATTQTARASSYNLQTGKLLGLPSNLGIENFLGLGNGFSPDLDATATNSHNGSGTTTRNGSLNTTMTALIKEILPSGNYRIEGKRTVTVNNEEQILVLSGIVRKEDINFDNTISSTLIANSSITYEGRGAITDQQRIGWAGQILSFIWPF